MKKKYLVCGWLDDSGYDHNDEPDERMITMATSQGDAESRADAAWRRRGITCSVVVAYEQSHLTS